MMNANPTTTRELYKYGNLRVTANGEIYNLYGQPEPVKKNGLVRVFIDGEERHILAAKVVYEAVSGEKIKNGSVARFSDGDKENLSFDNISFIERKEYFKSFDFEPTKKISKEAREVIIKEYNRDERKKHGFKGIWSKPTIPELAEKYGCSKSTIQKILNNAY